MTPNELFFKFMERTAGAPEVIVAPVYGAYFCSSWLGRKWIPNLLTPEVVEDLLNCGEAAGIIPIICLGWWDLNPFGFGIQEISKDEESHRYAWQIEGKSKSLYQVFEDRPAVGPTTIEKPIKSIDDYQVICEAVGNLEKNRDRVFHNIRMVLEQVGERGVVYLNVPLPHLIFGLADDQQLIYDLADYPDELSSVIDTCDRTMHQLVDIGLEAGIRLFFCGTYGILGPKLLRKYMLPYAIRLREKLNENDAFMYLHECGNMKALFDLYNEIRPDILEGFDSPPVGDVDDLRSAREELDPRIIFKGNIRLEDLKEGPPERIRQLCSQTLDSVEGYRHILGTSCSILYDTPMEHARILSEFGSVR